MRRPAGPTAGRRPSPLDCRTYPRLQSGELGVDRESDRHERGISWSASPGCPRTSRLRRASRRCSSSSGPVPTSTSPSTSTGSSWRRRSVSGAVTRDPRDPAFRAGVRQRFARQDPRASRYWELVGILNGKHPMSGHVADWRWIVQALLHRIPAPWATRRRRSSRSGVRDGGRDSSEHEPPSAWGLRECIAKSRAERTRRKQYAAQSSPLSGASGFLNDRDQQ
jgi:hypothetical protein